MVARQVIHKDDELLYVSASGEWLDEEIAEAKQDNVYINPQNKFMIPLKIENGYIQFGIVDCDSDDMDEQSDIIYIFPTQAKYGLPVSQAEDFANMILSAVKETNNITE